jgi:hypothetical protein
MTKYIFWVQGREVITEGDSIAEAMALAEQEGIVSWGTVWTDPSAPPRGDVFRTLRQHERGDVR